MQSLTAVSDLADAVLPLIRTRADLWRWSAANVHGRYMHEAVAILEEAADTEDPAVVFAVTRKAIASALKVIMRADDSSGIIGDACRALLDLHPKVAAAAKPPAAKLVDWMIKSQFDNECDYFAIDPVACAPALDENGTASYRAKLADLEASLGPRPQEDERWTVPHRAEWLTLDRIRLRSRGRPVHRRAARVQPPPSAAATGVRPRRTALINVIRGRSR